MKTHYAKDRREWRTWLQKNHDKCDEIWLIYYKKDSGKARIPYEEAVEEALCFGWIDGKIKRLDDARFAQRFTPRRPRSLWNEPNIQRAERLIAEGKMTSSGLAAFNAKRPYKASVIQTELPKELEAKFRGQAAAWKNYQNFPPYYRKMTTGWVAAAKKAETRLGRLEKLIEFSARNERIKFM